MIQDRLPCSSTGLTRRLIDLTMGVRDQQLPERTRRIAAHCLLDWTATTLAGRFDPVIGMIVDTIFDEGGKQSAPLLGWKRRVTPRQAALVNGSASHVLDLDDVHLASRVHPSCVVMPVLVSLASARSATGLDAIGAFVAGVEMQSRVAKLMGEAHYRLGWHNTATLGAIGAAVAACKMLRLSNEKASHAVGLAATMTGGLRASFGTMAKPLHAGRAAETGILAAQLAERGFEAARDPINAYAEVAGGGTSNELAETSILDSSDVFALDSVIFKYSASCYGTHAPIEAVLQLGTVAREFPETTLFHVEVEPQYMTICNIEHPRDALETRFSIRHCVALALLGRDMMADASFSITAACSPDVVGLRNRITVSASSDLRRANARITVKNCGRTLSTIHIDASTPEGDLEKQERRLLEKFGQISSPILSREEIEHIGSEILDFERMERFDRYCAMFDA